ncbi:gluconokinase [Rubrivivax gelatinosus]|nr:gluconokinase [Rubrivivax gelatinosus]
MQHIVVMGVGGCGKSSLGQALATALALPLIEGDDFHPAANIEKMRAGQPLDDADRTSWLAALGAQLQVHPGGAVLTCSALKRSYRERLRAAAPGLLFAHLVLTREAARERVAARPGHPFPPSLVDSQFDALESPAGEAGVLTLDALEPLPRLCEITLRWLAAEPAGKDA